MKIIKSDRRYKYHSYGFEYILQFSTTTEDRKKYQSILQALESVHGPYLSWEMRSGLSYQAHNTNFKVDFSRKLKRRRIYLKTEKELTFFLLKGNVS